MGASECLCSSQNRRISWPCRGMSGMELHCAKNRCSNMRTTWAHAYLHMNREIKIDDGWNNEEKRDYAFHRGKLSHTSQSLLQMPWCGWLSSCSQFKNSRSNFEEIREVCTAGFNDFGRTFFVVEIIILCLAPRARSLSIEFVYTVNWLHENVGKIP